MSVSLASYESIFNFASKFYLETMTPFFTKDYLQVLIAMIEYIMKPPNVIRYIITVEPLQEPIASKYPEFVLFSIPLIASIVNAPLLPKNNEIKKEKNYNILDILNVSERETAFKEQKITMSSDKKFIYLILIRLTEMIQHWHHHILTKTEYCFTHQNFKSIEIAKESGYTFSDEDDYDENKSNCFNV